MWSRSALRSRARSGDILFQLAEVAVPCALFAEILRRRTLAAEAAAVLGMRIESDHDDNPTGEVRPRSTEDRSKRPKWRSRAQ
jgi:hypothetical protein